MFCPQRIVPSKKDPVLMGLAEVLSRPGSPGWKDQVEETGLDSSMCSTFQEAGRLQRSRTRPVASTSSPSLMVPIVFHYLSFCAITYRRHRESTLNDLVTFAHHATTVTTSDGQQGLLRRHKRINVLGTLCESLPMKGGVTAREIHTLHFL